MPRDAPMPRTQAVVARPRNRSSSPSGARIAPAIRFSTNPDVSPAGGSGLSGVTVNSAWRIAATGTVTAMTGTAHNAPAPISDRAFRSGRRTPISAQLKEPVSMTSRRMSAM